MFVPGYFSEGYWNGFFPGEGEGDAPAATAPPASADSSIGYGDQWTDRNPQDSDYIIRDDDEDVFPSRLVRVTNASLQVLVRATLLHVVVTKKGNTIFLEATFTGPPNEVYVVYTRPGDEEPITDPGFGQRGSTIRSDDTGTTYTFAIDTNDCNDGKLAWHMWGVFDNHQEHDDGVVHILGRKPQLL